MKNTLQYLIILISTLPLACSENSSIAQACDQIATVKDLRGLDGCGWAFELANGEVVFPIPIFRCGTPPLPENEPVNPLENFDWVDGKKVWLSFERPSQDMVSICMAGEYVYITCMQEIDSNTGTE